MNRSLKDSIVLRVSTQAELEIARDLVDQVGALSYTESNERAKLIVPARDIEMLLDYLRVVSVGYSPIRQERNTRRSLAAQRLCKRVRALVRHVRDPRLEEMEPLALSFYGMVDVPLETYGERKVARKLTSVTDCSVSPEGVSPRLVANGYSVPTLLDHLDSIVSTCANPSQARAATNLRGRLTLLARERAERSESRLREFQTKRQQQFRRKKK